MEINIIFFLSGEVFVTWSLLGRERTLGMSVCVWWPLFFSAGRLLPFGEFLLVFSIQLSYKVRRSRINEEKLSYL